MLERILVPLDGSATAEAVLVQVRRLLKRADAEVLLLSAVELDVLPAYESQKLRDTLPGLAQEYVRGVAERLTAEGIRARPLVATGSAAPQILAAVKEHKASLIALSTHGRTGLLRFTLGSVAEKILRSAEVPVLVMRSGAQPPREVEFRKVLVPVDGSDRSFEVLPVASQFAQAYGAKLIVVSAREYDPTLHGMVAVPVPLEPAPVEHVRKAVAMFTHAGNAVEGEVLDGDPASAILEFAAKARVDLIAMATHGRSGFVRWMLGSVTEKVVRHAASPVLVVRNRNERL